MTESEHTTPSGERTKVVLVNNTDKVRPEVDKLTRQLDREDFDVTVILPDSCHSTLTRYEGVDYRFFSAWFVPNVRYTIPGPSFVSLLTDELPDAAVLHVIGYAFLPSTIATMVGRRFDVDTVVTVDAFLGVNWSYGNRYVDLVAKTYTHTLGRLTLSSADYAVGLGEYLRDDMARFSSETTEIRTIPNGVDVDRYRPNDAVRRTTDGGAAVTDLLFVGRLDTVKGVPYLLRAVAKLLEDGDYRLTIVGDGSRRDDVERLARSLGISDSVSFEGWQTDVLPYYQRSDVFVLPSLSEGLPTVIMEAQACGLPVVSTDVGGARELVKAGRIVPKEDPDALRTAIADVAEADLDELGRTARRHVRTNFSLERMVDAYERLYRTAAGVRPRVTQNRP